MVARNQKLVDLAKAGRRIEQARSEGRRVVMANGCFDLLHVGHIRYLEGAAAEGDFLLVALNSDTSVRSLKGSGRPLFPERERAEILAALECVDCIVIFDDRTVDAILRRFRPDVHAKGTDYTEENVPERETVLGYGGRIAIVGDPKDHSSREILTQIKDEAPQN